MQWLPLDEIGVKGKKPWFPKRTALVMTTFSVLLCGVFYFPILQGIFLAIRNFWLTAFVGSCFYFLWSYPRQFLVILLGIFLWLLVGPGMAGLWIWGIVKIMTVSKGNWLLVVVLVVIWSFGPIALGKRVLDRFGLITLARKIFKKRFLQ